VVIEHVFVITMDEQPALQLAWEFLSRRGFVPAPAPAASAGGSQSGLHMMRGFANARHAKSIVDLPQRVHLHFDRGRVTLAVSIEPSAVWGGAHVLSVGAASGHPSRMKIHQALLHGIAVGLERLLADRASAEAAAADWDAAERASADAAHRRRRRQQFTFLIVFGGLGLLIFLIVLIAMLS
jgi:hypothetical protein